MIAPVSTEADWLPTLLRIPEFVATDKPIVLISPHPDDETLGAGGFLLSQRIRCVDVTVVAVTDGENAYPAYPNLAAIRQQEQMNALKILKVPEDRIIRFGLPDSGLRIKKNELIDGLMPLVSVDTHLMAPWRGDFHPDHALCGAAAEEVAHRTGATLTSYFFWTWHLGTLPVLNNLQLRSFPLDSKLLRAKADALALHQSQLCHPSGIPILPESLLAPARRAFEVFAVS